MRALFSWFTIHSSSLSKTRSFFSGGITSNPGTCADRKGSSNGLCRPTNSFAASAAVCKVKLSVLTIRTKLRATRTLVSLTPPPRCKTSGSKLASMPVHPLFETNSAKYSCASTPTDEAFTRSGKSFVTSTTSLPSDIRFFAIARILVSLVPSRKKP